MTLDEIYSKEKISVRSYHVCKYNKLNTLEEIRKYYFEHKSFQKLRNCGRRSDEELIEICNYYKEYKFESLREEEAKKENPLKIIVSELNRVQREVINSFIFVNTNNLSIRSKNAIKLHLNGNLKIKNFAEKILISESFRIKYLKNIGLNSIPELEQYVSVVKKFLIDVSETKYEKHLISLKNNFLIQRTFSNVKLPSEILESESIFLLTNFLLDENALFEKKPTYIFKKTLKIYQNQKELSLEDVALEIDLTRERVRQIRKKCIGDLLKKLLFIRSFNDDLFQKYGIDTNSDHLEINLDLVDLINITNQTNFSREFITYILSSYLCSDFSLIGNIEDVLQPKDFIARNRHNWNNIYLVKKEIVSEINFNSLTNDIDNRIIERIEETYSFNFKSYLSKFLTNNSIDILDLASPICEKIVNDEFNLFLDLKENLVFKRNTIKQAYEYAYEALEHLGKPSKVKEIFKKVKEIYPNYDTEEAKIRVSMKRKNGFVPVGRKSVFGLKKWEDEMDDFKGGTIRKIVEDYLLCHNEPKHISLITSNVLKYRPKSNQSSILQNLRLDESGLYIFYKGSNIGLSTKKYNENFIKASSDKKAPTSTWFESLTDLKIFINKENRLPYSSGCPEYEKKLYRWYNIQIRKNNNSKLSRDKARLISELEDNNFQINGKRKDTLESNYLELTDFINKKFRLPSSLKKGEESLYRFFYKQRKLFDKDDLDIDDKIKFLEVGRLIQKIKYENKRN